MSPCWGLAAHTIPEGILSVTAESVRKKGSKEASHLPAFRAPSLRHVYRYFEPAGSKALGPQRCGWPLFELL